MEYEWLVVAAVAVLAAAGMLNVARRFRARAAKRWLIALNTFADREIAEHRRWRN
jgi:hypothetical protein